jgi:POT family proton-dependent oligopeptide transporter
MLLTAGCYAIMASAAFAGGNFGRVNVSWLISAYAVITMGELCLSPMGLSLVSKLAPWKIRGMMMGGWFAATAIGNYLSGLVGSLWDNLLHSTFFIILIITSLFAAALLFLLLKFLNPTIKEAEEQAREIAEQQ